MNYNNKFMNYFQNKIIMNYNNINSQNYNNIMANNNFNNQMINSNINIDLDANISSYGIKKENQKVNPEYMTSNQNFADYLSGKKEMVNPDYIVNKSYKNQAYLSNYMVAGQYISLSKKKRIISVNFNYIDKYTGINIPNIILRIENDSDISTLINKFRKYINDNGNIKKFLLNDKIQLDPYSPERIDSRINEKSIIKAILE